MKITKTILMFVFLVCLVPAVSASVVLNMTFDAGNSYDYSANHLNSTISNAIWTPYCGDGHGCYYFNVSGPVGSSIVVQNSSVLATPNFTVVLWAKPKSPSGLQTIIAKSPDDSTQRWAMQFNTAIGGYFGAVNAQSFPQASYPYPTENWTFLALTFNGTYGWFYYGLQGSNLSVYVPAVSSISYNYTMQGPLAIGKWIGVIGPRYYKGYVDNVLLYNNYMNSSQITDLFNSYAPPVPPIITNVLDYPDPLYVHNEDIGVIGFAINGTITQGTIPLDKIFLEIYKNTSLFRQEWGLLPNQTNGTWQSLILYNETWGYGTFSYNITANDTAGYTSTELGSISIVYVPPYSPDHGYGIYSLMEEVGIGSYFLFSLFTNPLFYLLILIVLFAIMLMIGTSIGSLILKYK